MANQSTSRNQNNVSPPAGTTAKPKRKRRQSLKMSEIMLFVVLITQSINGVYILVLNNLPESIHYTSLILCLSTLLTMAQLYDEGKENPLGLLFLIVFIFATIYCGVLQLTPTSQMIPTIKTFVDAWDSIFMRVINLAVPSRQLVYVIVYYKNKGGKS